MTSVRKYTAFLASIALGVGAAVAIADDVEVEATIQNVSEEDGSLTVEFSETGVRQTFRIDEDTEINFERSGRAIPPLRSGIEDLRSGQEVMLRFDDEVFDDDWVVLHIITIS